MIRNARVGTPGSWRRQAARSAFPFSPKCLIGVLVPSKGGNIIGRSPLHLDSDASRGGSEGASSAPCSGVFTTSGLLLSPLQARSREAHLKSVHLTLPDKDMSSQMARNGADPGKFE